MNAPFELTLRPGQNSDLDALEALEVSLFAPERREKRSTILRSLRSPHQEVWAAWSANELAGAIFLRVHLHTIRIYSLGVRADFQGHGVGRGLVEKAIERTRTRRLERVSLEVEARDARLQGWYGSFGFRFQRRLPDYYAKDWDAVRLVLPVGLERSSCGKGTAIDAESPCCLVPEALACPPG